MNPENLILNVKHAQELAPILPSIRPNEI